MKIYHLPLITHIKGGKVPSPLVEKGQGVGYFRNNTILPKEEIIVKIFFKMTKTDYGIFPGLMGEY